MPFDNTPPAKATPKVIIDRAIEAIETHGWIQGEEGDVEVGFCVWGALMHVTEPDEVQSFSTAAAMLTGCIGGRMSKWNDAHGRTKDDVIAKLREAREKLNAF